MNFSVLIPIIVGLVSFVIGYIAGRYSNESEGNLTFLESKITRLEKELQECYNSKAHLKVTEMEHLESQRKEPVKVIPQKITTVPFNAYDAKQVFGKKILLNDLKIVEGIGPKIELLF